MITNPSQRQIDTRHKLDKVIVINKSIFVRILEKLLDTITGNKPTFVEYNGKQYHSDDLIIYSKEEIASMYEQTVLANIGNTSSRYKSTNKVILTGNINNVMITLPDNRNITIPYNVLHEYLQHIDNLYTRAIDNQSQFQYVLVDTSKRQVITYLDYKNNVMEKYEFINNLYLDISILQDLDTKKYTATERFLGIELSKQYDTIDETKHYLEELIIIRLRLLRENNKKDCEKIFKYTQIDIKKLGKELNKMNDILEKDENAKLDKILEGEKKLKKLK